MSIRGRMAFFFLHLACPASVARVTMVAKAKWANNSSLFDSSGKWKCGSHFLNEKLCKGLRRRATPSKTEAAKAKHMGLVWN